MSNMPPLHSSLINELSTAQPVEVEGVLYLNGHDVLRIALKLMGNASTRKDEAVGVTAAPTSEPSDASPSTCQHTNGGELIRPAEYITMLPGLFECADCGKEVAVPLYKPGNSGEITDTEVLEGSYDTAYKEAERLRHVLRLERGAHDYTRSVLSHTNDAYEALLKQVGTPMPVSGLRALRDELDTIASASMEGQGVAGRLQAIITKIDEGKYVD